VCSEDNDASRLALTASTGKRKNKAKAKKEEETSKRNKKKRRHADDGISQDTITQQMLRARTRHP